VSSGDAVRLLARWHLADRYSALSSDAVAMGKVVDRSVGRTAGRYSGLSSDAALMEPLLDHDHGQDDSPDGC